MGVLNGKTAIITGGATGIGKAIAKRFLAEGAQVAICGRRSKVLAAAAAELGGEVYHASVDVTEPTQIGRFVSNVVDRFGGVDILVNNAGIMRFSPIHETTQDTWQSLLNTNLLGPWRMMQALLPVMASRGGGSIINISSIAGHKALPGAGGYCTSKAALTMMSQVAALEWADKQIRVNIIAPGLVEQTELADPIFGAEGVPAFYDKLRGLHPLGRSGVPDDVAATAVFLAGDESSWMTGAMVPLDGGRHLATNRPPV